MFPNSAYMVLLHGNFMIDVLGVGQSGSSRIEVGTLIGAMLWSAVAHQIAITDLSLLGGNA